MNKPLDNNSEEVIDTELEQKNENENTEHKNTVPLPELLAERKKRQDLEKRLQAIEDANKQEEERKLSEQGELRKLLDMKESEISLYKSKADAYDEFEKQERAEAKKKLGNKWDEDYETLPIKTLRKIVKDFYIPDALDMDSGNGARKGEPVLTAEQKKDADQKGLSYEMYYELLQDLEKRKKAKSGLLR